MPLLLVQGNPVIHPFPLVVLSWFYRPYLISAGCLLSSLKSPRLTGHFQVLKDISDACARWHWMLFPVGGTPAGCLKISVILIHDCAEEIKRLSVSSVYIKCMISSSKWNLLYWGNLVEPDLVWKSHLGQQFQYKHISEGPSWSAYFYGYGYNCPQGSSFRRKNLIFRWHCKIWGGG